MKNYITLEFNEILKQLADKAQSHLVKARCLALVPSLNEAEVIRRLDETTQTKRIIEQIGTPPLPTMTDLQKVIDLIAIDAILMPDQIAHVSSFLVSCRRIRAYLEKAKSTDIIIAWYGESINQLSELENEIERCIRNGIVDDKASTELANIRRHTAITIDQIKAKLDALLRKNKTWFSESFVSLRNGHYTLPVKRQHKNNVAGSVIDLSQTGGTCFIEPVSVGRLQSELSALQIEEDSIFCLHNLVLCDIGDGQSITENLSTFSSHIKNIIEILRQANLESLVLLDELGSGTDPAEGMGLAIAILDELSAKKCLFVVTTHYPEIKEYAANKPKLVNARMAFDKESLLPLYRLEIGEAGASCALYIAERLGMQQHMLIRAHEAAYGNSTSQYEGALQQSNSLPAQVAIVPQIAKQEAPKPKVQSRSETFNLGDSVIVYPQKETGIVYARSNAKGEIGVQIKGKKTLINHKRLKLLIATSELYPDDYDFSIIFDSVANRKARHQLDKGHYEGNVIVNEWDRK